MTLVTRSRKTKTYAVSLAETGPDLNRVLIYPNVIAFYISTSQTTDMNTAVFYWEAAMDPTAARLVESSENAFEIFTRFDYLYGYPDGFTGQLSLSRAFWPMRYNVVKIRRETGGREVDTSVKVVITVAASE